MPGIFGVLGPPLPGQTRGVAERMRSVMCHQPNYFSDLWVDPSGRMAAGCVTLFHPTQSPSQSGNCGDIVWLDGELYDYSERRRELESEGIEFSTNDHAELLGHGVRTWGDAFLKRSEGFFSAAIWRRDKQTLLLITDHFGMKPLYFSLVGEGVVFASEIKALLAHSGVSRKRSLKGVAQFLSFGQLLGNETLFEDIHTVPPASLVSLEGKSGALVARQYWSLIQGRAFASQPEALTVLDASFAGAVKRRIAGPLSLGLSLSGGLDARTILAAIPRGSLPVTSVSIGISGSIDHRAATRLAQLAGAEHHCEYLSDDFLTQFPVHVRKLVYLTDGHYLDQAITVPTLRAYQALGIQALLRGHAGELLHMDKAYAFSIPPRDLNFRDVDSVERWLWSHLTSFMIEGIGHDVLRPELRSDAAGLARESLHQALALSDGAHPPAQLIWNLFIRERLRRETAMSMQMFSSVVNVRLPYLDSDFVQATMNAPPALKTGDIIQSYILRQRLPAFLKIVNANTGARLDSSWLNRRIGTLKVRALSKLGVPGYQPYERLGLWLSNELHRFVAELLLSDRSIDRGLLDLPTLRRVLDDHRDRRRNHTYLIMALLIFEMGQRQFIDEDATELPASP